MPRNTLTDLRNHLFETIEALKDDENPMDVDRARTISQVAAQLIESAKVEVKFLEVTGARDDGEFWKEGKKKLGNGGPA